MKTIKKDSEIKRVMDKEAFDMVKQGWVFIKKNEWKKTVRDIGKTEKKENKEKKVEEKAEKKNTGFSHKSDKISKYTNKKYSQKA